MEIICAYCKEKKQIEKTGLWRKRKFCCLRCFYDSLKGKKRTNLPPDWREKWEKNRGGAVKGKPKSEIHKKRIGEAHSKLKHPWVGERNHRNRGEKSPLWKGGISPINARIRCEEKYIKWRRAVFARDNWTCQSCWQKGGKLNAHHIKPFIKYPNSRTDLENGITLCYKCHRKAHRDLKQYGKKFVDIQN